MAGNHGNYINCHFFQVTNSQYFFFKISGIDIWVLRINWSKVHGCGSTYMVVRLSLTKWPFSRQPDNHMCWVTAMLLHQFILHSNPRTNLWNFGEKILRIGGFEKIKFFNPPNPKFKISKKNSSSLKSFTNYGVAWLGLYFYDYHYFQPKIRGSIDLWNTLNSISWRHLYKPIWWWCLDSWGTNIKQQ